MKDQMFKVGDKAVYPAQGVAVVTGIESKEISGNTEVFYILKLLDSKREILVPMKKAKQVGLRTLVRADQTEKIFNLLQQMPVKKERLNWNRRYRNYIEKLKSGSAYDAAEVLRDLYVMKGKKGLSFVENGLLETAKGLLVKELAVAGSQTEEQVEERIQQILSSTAKHQSHESPEATS